MVQIKICFLFVAFVAAYDLKFDYQIIEGSARFVENIETNLDKNTVKIYTPAHNDVLESYTMQDFQRGQQIRCLPSLHQCRLRDIDRTTAPDAGKVTESFVHSWNEGTNSITNANSKVIKELYYVDGEEVANTVSLGEDLKKFYGRFQNPLYKEKKIPSDAEVLNITSSTGGRFRRELQILSACQGEQPKVFFGIDSGRSCNYLKICEIANNQGRFEDCNNLHVTSPLVYKCLCCPEVTDVRLERDDCKCIKLML